MDLPILLKTSPHSWGSPFGRAVLIVEAGSNGCVARKVQEFETGSRIWLLVMV
jgi:hypothetical protein